MRRWLPSPLVSAGLFALWLILARALTPGHILLALIVAVAMPLWLKPLRPLAGPVRNPLTVLRLVLRVGGDVVLSGIDVARGILRSRPKPALGTFVTMPLELRDEHALAALAMILAVIPGTVWTELAPDRSSVLLHVFGLEDEATFIHHIKSRYERDLKEIFE